MAGIMGCSFIDGRAAVFCGELVVKVWVGGRVLVRYVLRFYFTTWMSRGRLGMCAIPGQTLGSDISTAPSRLTGSECPLAAEFVIYSRPLCVLNLTKKDFAVTFPVRSERVNL